MDQQEEQKRKGISMIIFSVILGLVGGVFFVVYLYTGIEKMNKSMIRFKVPGSMEIALKETGDYTIFHEYRSNFEGKIYDSGDNVSGLMVKVTEKSTGKEIPLSSPSSHSTYNMGGYAGYSLLNFKITNPGEYIFDGEYQDKSGSDVILSVQYNFGGELLSAIGGSILILFVTIGISVTLFVLGVLKVIKRNVNKIADNIYNNNRYYGG